MDFADNLTPEDMKAWNKSITADASGEKMAIGVNDLLVMAVGCIGMSHDDFCKCIFGEFESICKAWREMTERESREVWERARTIATILIQPQSRKGIRLHPGSFCLCPGLRNANSRAVSP